MKNLSLLVLGLVFSSFVAAGEIESIFSDHFYNQYVNGRCGVNIKVFLRALNNAGVSLDEFKVVAIKNVGFSVFGMVNAEKARGQRFNQPYVGEANWYHHVILLDGDNRVYDFDFMTEPTITGFSDYAERMFLDEEECTTKISGEFCAGRKDKLGDYMLEWFSAEDYLKGKETGHLFRGSLGESLDR